ncbi:FAD-binding oxidoreductase [Paroceanicella profunda]|uniref:FAD-binding oxidoreductase n=1 Tax=Paroceanicella profunda TaxID=2579971 RepID=A0A5B8FHA8_9RHOB|nr:FAD-binding oxidoreductase [Paroceanicella profunda]QDL91967.1 FAD-binding oxidoreductase [Paroceanicella profunda]
MSQSAPRALNDASPAFLEHLEARVGPGILRPAGAADLEEPRGRYHGRAGAVALPRDTEGVAAIVCACAEARVGIVPRAGGTGLVAGQVMPEGPLPLLLSVERLSAVRDASPADNALTVEAGVTLAGVQEAAEAVNRLFPLSLGSEGSCRIGGNLATNAGGVQVLRYGNARDLCLGIEAVLPDGSVLHGLRRLRKDNTGYDLRNLLIGSEGSLGIITAASLRLFPRPADTATAWVATPSPAAAARILQRALDRLGEAVSGFELIHRTGLDFLAEHMPDLRPPLAEGTWFALIEASGGAGAQVQDGLEAALAEAFEAGDATDAVLASSLAQRQAMWQIRETIPEANRAVGAIASHDISLPLSAIPEFIDEGLARLHALDASMRVNCFGHLGDGNLHYNVFPAAGRDRADYDALRARVTETVHDLVHAREGSVSAEHGIGRLKVDDLVRYGDPAKLAAMRAIKQALDPVGIMNPGALLA